MVGHVLSKIMKMFPFLLKCSLYPARFLSSPLNVCWESYFTFMYFLPSFLMKPQEHQTRASYDIQYWNANAITEKKLGCYLHWTGMTSQRNSVVFLTDCMSWTGFIKHCMRLKDLQPKKYFNSGRLSAKQGIALLSSLLLWLLQSWFKCSLATLAKTFSLHCNWSCTGVQTCRFICLQKTLPYIENSWNEQERRDLDAVLYYVFQTQVIFNFL